MANVKNRNIVFVIAMHMITFGIYSIYWFLSTAREIRELAKSEKPKSGLYITALILIAASLLMAGAGIALAATGVGVCCTLILSLLQIAASITAAVFSLIFLWQYAKGINKISKGARSAGGLFALFLFSSLTFNITGLIGIGLTQAELNKRAPKKKK